MGAHDFGRRLYTPGRLSHKRSAQRCSLSTTRSSVGWGAGVRGGFVVNIGTCTSVGVLHRTGCFWCSRDRRCDLPGGKQPRRAARGRPPRRRRRGYRSVLANRCMRRIMSLSVLLMLRLRAVRRQFRPWPLAPPRRTKVIASPSSQHADRRRRAALRAALSQGGADPGHGFMCVFPAACWLLVLGIHVGGGLPAATGSCCRSSSSAREILVAERAAW